MDQRLPADTTMAAVRVGRLQATLGVLAEVGGAERDREPVIALRTFGPGHLAMAVAGAIDDATIARLRALLDDPHIRGLSTCELIVDLSGVHTCDPGLVRLLSGLRARRLAEGGRVELRNPPEALGPELDDASLCEAFTVYDAVRRGDAGQAELA